MSRLLCPVAMRAACRGDAADPTDGSPKCEVRSYIFGSKTCFTPAGIDLIVELHEQALDHRPAAHPPNTSSKWQMIK
jgi:hypothetical protein